MLRGLGISVAQFLLFSAFVLTLLANMGQLTTNIVARNISFAQLQIYRLDGFLANLPKDPVTNKPSAPMSDLAMYNYPAKVAWGLYDHCMSSDQLRLTCSTNEVNGAPTKSHQMGEAVDVGLTMLQFLRMTGGKPRDQANQVEDYMYSEIGTFKTRSIAAQYLIFLGAIFLFVSFVLGCGVKRGFTALSGAFSFLSFAVLVSGASLWTFFAHKMVSVDFEYAEFKYGNALWFLWASVFCTLVATLLLFTSSTPKRRRYDDDEGPYY